MSDFLLLENSDNLLLENGVDAFLLEEDTAEGEVAATTDFRFDSWEMGSLEPNPEDRDPIDYYISWVLMDNGSENIDKRLEAIRVTAKTSDNGKVQIHAFQQGEEISKTDIDEGTNSTYEIDLDDTSVVTRGKRIKEGPKNMSLWTPRFSGTWDGLGEPDRLDELILEISHHGTKK